MGSAERRFKVRLMVEIDAYGLPEVHESPIIAKVNRELELALGGNVHVTKAAIGPLHGGLSAWIPDTEVVKEEVHSLGEIQEVPPVRNEEAATGSGLRSLPDHMLAMRLPFPDQSTEGSAP